MIKSLQLSAKFTSDLESTNCKTHLPSQSVNILLFTEKAAIPKMNQNWILLFTRKTFANFPLINFS